MLMMRGSRSLRKGVNLSAGTAEATNGIPSPANSRSMESYSAWIMQEDKEKKQNNYSTCETNGTIHEDMSGWILMIVTVTLIFSEKKANLLVFIISFITTTILTNSLIRKTS